MVQMVVEKKGKRIQSENLKKKNVLRDFVQMIALYFLRVNFQLNLLLRSICAEMQSKNGFIILLRGNFYIGNKMAQTND